MTRRIRGFTLIELLVAVVIIGILAAIAIRSYSRAQEQAWVSSLRGDLRHFALGQESYYYDNGVYSAGVAGIEASGFRMSPGVTITVNEATNLGWSATASHVRIADRCYIYSGNAAVVGVATEPGVIKCD